MQAGRTRICKRQKGRLASKFSAPLRIKDDGIMSFLPEDHDQHHKNPVYNERYLHFETFQLMTTAIVLSSTVLSEPTIITYYKDFVKRN